MGNDPVEKHGETLLYVHYCFTFYLFILELDLFIWSSAKKLLNSFAKTVKKHSIALKKSDYGK